jgi:hypothetical protein
MPSALADLSRFFDFPVACRFDRDLFAGEDWMEPIVFALINYQFLVGLFLSVCLIRNRFQ